MKISPEKTAINNGVARSAKILGKSLNKKAKILDMGFGFGRNSVFLKEEYDFEVDGLETKLQLKKQKEHLSKIKCFSKIYEIDEIIESKYEGILISYVINVIPSKRTRMNILNRAKKLLVPGGKLLVEVRHERVLKNIKTKVKYNDGFVIGKGKVKTFQKCYNEESLTALLKEVGFNNFKIIKNGRSIIAEITNNTAFGQMSLNNLSSKSNYLQLDICGLTKEEALEKYSKYKTKIPVILHGDWNKKGASENNLRERKKEYVKIIKILSSKTLILGLTLHPPTKSKFTEKELKNEITWIENETGINVFLENRSNNRFVISTPKEIINFSKDNKMTIDIPQLYIACDNDEIIFKKTLNKLNWPNIKEIHLGGLMEQRIERGDKRNGNYVAQQLNENNCIDYKAIKEQLLQVPFITLEILGNEKTFEKNLAIFLNDNKKAA